MNIDRDQLVNVTDEEWELIQSAITSEADRRAEDAARTARKNAEKSAKLTMEKAIADRLAEELERLQMDETQKMELERKEFEKNQKILEQKAQELAMKEKSFKVKERLVEEEIPTADAFVSMLSSVDDAKFDDILDEFVGTYKDTVKSQIDHIKQELAAGAAPPAGEGGVVKNVDDKVAEALSINNTEAAIGVLLESAIEQ